MIKNIGQNCIHSKNMHWSDADNAQVNKILLKESLGPKWAKKGIARFLLYCNYKTLVLCTNTAVSINFVAWSLWLQDLKDKCPFKSQSYEELTLRGSSHHFTSIPLCFHNYQRIYTDTLYKEGEGKFSCSLFRRRNGKQTKNKQKQHTHTKKQKTKYRGLRPQKPCLRVTS